MVETSINQEKALVGAFSVIVQLRRIIVCTVCSFSENQGEMLKYRGNMNEFKCFDSFNYDLQTVVLPGCILSHLDRG